MHFLTISHTPTFILAEEHHTEQAAWGIKLFGPISPMVFGAIEALSAPRNSITIKLNKMEALVCNAA